MTIVEIIDKFIDGIIRGCLLGGCFVLLYYGGKEWVKKIKAFIQKRKEKRSNKNSINSEC